jgi:BNR repeat protein
MVPRPRFAVAGLSRSRSRSGAAGPLALATLIAIALIAAALGPSVGVRRDNAAPADPVTADAGGTGGDEAAAELEEEEEGRADDPSKSKVYRKSGIVEPGVVEAAPGTGVIAPAIAAGTFAPQIRLGYQTGDGWEPAIAADASGRVYMVYAQYEGVPGCSACQSPTQILQVSNDRGLTWRAPRVLQQNREKGWDSQIVVDPADGLTVYASWIERQKSDVIVAKSTDFGAKWTYTVANRINKGADKDILAVRGPDVYVAYDHSTQMYVASSHDGGATFSETKINANANLGWALAGGGTVDPAGNVYFSWNGYEQNGQAKGPVNLFISKSTDGGRTFSNTLLDVSGDPRDCSADECGWAYLGAAITMTSDANGILYALWNSGPIGKAPNRVWFSRSTDRGRTWSTKVDVSRARAGAEHAFPAIAARGSGDVRISWMDSRARTDNTLWNTYYRSSTNAGASWSTERDISSFVGGYTYIKPDGFEFPYGDYYEIDIDDLGTAHVANGQGIDYDSPGAIWYTRGR